MANVCTGVSVAWNGITLGEVTDLDVTVGGGLPQGRDSRYTVDRGTITLKCLSTAAISESQYGVKATLQITGGGLTFSTKAICQQLQLSGRVNDVARYSATYKISSE